MPDSTISGLTELTDPLASDELPVTHLGTTRKIRLDNLRVGLPVATAIDKGLMSAADKAALETAVADVLTLKSRPVSAIVASAATISVPNGADVIVLTGTTAVVTVMDALDYHTYTFYYPSGPGLNLFGIAMSAGDALVAVYTP